MRRSRFWLVTLALFWLLIGIAMAASSTGGYEELVDQAGAGDINERAVGTVFAFVALIGLVLLISSKERVRSGAIVVGLTSILFGVYGLIRVAAAEQARCPSIGFGSQRCADIKSGQIQGGWLLFIIACAVVVLLLIITSVAGIRRTPEPVPIQPEPRPDVNQQLRELAALRDDGILTEEEFQSRKQRLLDQDP